MTRLTRLLGLTLALLIAVTSQQMAHARAVMADAAGQVVLCTGQGTVTVTLDRSGAPMDAMHYCPDCAITLVDPPDRAPLSDPVWTRVAEVSPSASAQQHPLTRSAAPRARAPPVRL